MRADTRRVADVVVRMPKTLGRATTLAQARRAFTDDHVHTLLLTEAGRLLGTLVRSDIPDLADPSDPALGYAVLTGRTIAPDLDVDAARRIMVARGERRLAVVDDDGRLVGLLCLKRRLTGFCSDADVAARAADTTTSPPRADATILVNEPEGSLR